MAPRGIWYRLVCRAISSTDSDWISGSMWLQSNAGRGSPATLELLPLRARKRPVAPAPATLIAFAHELADLSGAALRQRFRRGLTVQNKAGAGQFDPVT